jgi:hypothetical protein
MAAAVAIAPVRRAVEAVAEAVAVMEPHRAGEESSFAASPDRSDRQAAANESPILHDAPSDPVEVEAPPIAPVDLDQGRPPIEVTTAHEIQANAEPLEDVETVAARRYRSNAKHKRWSWPLSRLQSGILALVIIDSIVIGWRTDFVRFLPQTASFYASIGLPVNLRGIVFDGVATSTEQHDNVPILVVEGNIVNDTSRIVDVPRLKFAVRNAARQEIYSWTAVSPRATLPPGQSASFRSRLASPPPDAHDVLVRFINRYDILAGER